MTRQYRVTPRAYHDLKTIGRYTQQTWGKMRRNAYLQLLDQRMAWLAAHPDLGRKRDDIHAGYHCFAEGEHLIFYTVTAEQIDIIGIVHQRMDIAGQFPMNEPP